MKDFLKRYWEWIAVDGLLHCVCSFAIVLAVYVLTFGLGTAVGVALLVGVMKEVVDLTIRKQPLSENHVHDLLCDAGGVLLAVLWVILT